MQSSGCGVTDVSCLCTASQGTFLPDFVVCVYSNCSRAISVQSLLDPLEFACDMLENPIPYSAITSAEAAGRSIETATKTTKTTKATTTPKTTITGGEAMTTVVSQTKGGSTLPLSTKPSTSIENTQKAGITSKTTDIQPSQTGSALLGTSTDSSPSTKTTTGGRTEQTDSSPFASPNGSNRQDRLSLFGLAVGLAGVLAIGY